MIKKSKVIKITFRKLLQSFRTREKGIFRVLCSDWILGWCASRRQTFVFGGHMYLCFCCFLQGLEMVSCEQEYIWNPTQSTWLEKNSQPCLVDRESAGEVIFCLPRASKNRQEITTSLSSAFVLAPLLCCCFPCCLSLDEVNSYLILLVILWKLPRSQMLTSYCLVCLESTSSLDMMGK